MSKIAPTNRNVIIFILLILLSNWITKICTEHEVSAVDPSDGSFIAITIEQGTGTAQIAAQLKSENLIRNTFLFKLKSRLSGLDGKYKAGIHSLSKNMSMDEIMEGLLAGRDNTVRFTIPEGYDVRRTAEALSSINLIDSDDFIDEIENGDFDHWFLETAPKGKSRLEGYLFPDTYEVFTGASEHEIIQKMLDQFGKVFTKEDEELALQHGLNVNEIIILASIIEREAVIPKDRPIIAGVFYNRLKIGMPLQSCATVQYILGEQKAVLSTADTRIDSPYNTYLIKGLPPAPICSPGKASIEAALSPEKSDYLYFLAKGDGSHVFSRTYEEHRRLKAKYIDNAR
jgi:UPF0755 protein